MKLRIPVFLQLSLLVTVFSVGSSLVALTIFKTFTKEVIEDEIFSKYLRESEKITRNLESILRQYEDKISFCLVDQKKCDSSFIEIVNFQESVVQRNLTNIGNSKYYYSNETGTTYLLIKQESKEYLVSLVPLQNELMDISVLREDYILIINRDGYVILNISSPFTNYSKLELDKDTVLKLKADITSGNFYLEGGLDFVSMNLFHNLPYLNLKLVIGNENKFVFYELNKIEKYAWKTFFLIIPAILLLSFAASQFEKKRFSKISKALKDLSNEKFSARIEEGKIRGLDEIDDLISAFNYMANELEKFHNLNISKIININTQLSKANEELNIAKSIADEANKAKTHFLATMSHDIRTPLNAIIGFTQIIQKSDNYHELPEQLKEQIHSIFLSGRNLSELINNILDLSKIEAGKMELNEEDVNLKILLQGIYSINTSLAEKKKITLEYKIDPEIPEVIITDRTKLNQILMNLCGNAIKFTPEEKRVYINVFKNGNNIEFKVKDEGIGIPKERHKSVFEVFEQSDKTISTNFGGTGLGLSIVKKMTELLGGTVILESELGTGSCFTIQIPLRASITEIKTKKRTVKKFERPYKILVIDDNKMNYEILRFHLKKLGLESHHAPDGESGLDLAFKLQPDIILLDIHMPGMNGIEVRKRLLANEKTVNIPTVVMSADVFSENKTNALEVAFSDFVSKPIDFDQLDEILEKNLIPKTNS